MIHQLLNLTRPLIVFDTETTGTNVKEDRIVEIGFEVWTAEGMTKEYRTLVNPGVSIPKGAFDVHGISDLDVQACRLCDRSFAAHGTEPILPGDPVLDCQSFKPWPSFTHLSASLASGFRNCDFAGQNVRFDLKILAAEMQRAGVEWSYAGARVIDSGRLEQILVPRSLSDLYEKYTGKKHDGAHGALSDVRASRVVLESQALVMIQKMPEGQGVTLDLAALHELQWPGMIDNDGKFRFVDGVPCFTRWGKYAEKPMRAADNGYWDWILKSDFDPEVKALAGQAKLGKFPEKV